MDTIKQQRTVDVIGSYDVVVCGGGPSGWISAVAAARSGAKTLLIEQYGFVGGMATAGYVVPISVFTYNNELVCGGIPFEFVERLVDADGAELEHPLGNVSFDPEVYKIVAQRMLLESGVNLMFHSFITGCVKKDGRITHIIINTKNGAHAVEAKIVIDATGDGDICAMADVPMQVTKLPVQPSSLCFCLGGVDTDSLEKIHHNLQGVNFHNEKVQSVLRGMEKTHSIPQFGGPWFCSIHRPGYVMVNMSRASADMLDAEQATKIECLLRENVQTFVKLLKENFKEFKNAVLVGTATQTGVRETRHILGTHVLTGDEYLHAFHFDDAIGRGCHPIDIHSGDNSAQVCRFLQKPAYIPYRSLIVDGFDNLLVPGRCFSADQESSASVRVQSSLMGLGQAAGAAAAQCCKAGVSVHDADVKSLQEQLRKWGAVI